MIALELTEVRKSFGALQVLKGVSLQVKEGEVLSIIGASGSGKSTLLRCVNLLETPESGRLRSFENEIDYADVTRGKVKSAQLNALRRSTGMVFQNFNLWPHLSVLQNITEAPIRVRGDAPAKAKQDAEALLNKVGLYDKKDAMPFSLSGGQQQRVAIARALAMRPRIMLFDEATPALDPEMVGEVLDLMRKLAEEGMTMLVVTHEMGFARHVSHRTAFVHMGEIVEIGPSERVLTRSENVETRKFLDRVLNHV